jgi:hypothetical protein
MADYFSPTVIQPAIPVADMTPLERLLLSHIFEAERQGESLYFFADEEPASMVWLDRPVLEAALAQSRTTPGSKTAAFVTEQLARVPADNVEIELDLSAGWEFIFQDILRRSAILRYITAVSSFICSTMRPHSFGGMAVLITAADVIAKSTSDFLIEAMRRAAPGIAAAPNRAIHGCNSR